MPDIAEIAKEITELVRLNGFSKTESGIEFEPLVVFEGTKTILSKHFSKPEDKTRSVVKPFPPAKKADMTTIPEPAFKVGDKVWSHSNDLGKVAGKVVQYLGYDNHGLSTVKFHGYRVECTEKGSMAEGRTAKFFESYLSPRQ